MTSDFRGGPRWSAVLVGSFGVGFGLAAMVVLAGQAIHAMEHGRWPALTPRTVIDDTLVRDVVPAPLRAWLQRPHAGVWLHPIVVWALDEIPLALLLGGLAVIFIRMALRFERVAGRW